jgi:CTP-dependent riboflavin kinase
MNNTINLTGVVKPGFGDASKWLTLLKDYYLKKTGMKDLFPGSLNIQLPKPFFLLDKRFKAKLILLTAQVKIKTKH